MSIFFFRYMKDLVPMNLISCLIQVLKVKTAIIRTLRQIQIQIRGTLSEIISTKIIGYTTCDAVQLAGNYGNLQQAYMSAKLCEVYRYRQQSTSLTELAVPNTHQMASVTPPAVVAAICQRIDCHHWKTNCKNFRRSLLTLHYFQGTNLIEQAIMLTFYVLTVNKRDKL